MGTHIVKITTNPAGQAGNPKFFRASNTLYTTTNSADTGIEPDTTANAKNTPLYDTGELMRAGWLDRINVYVQLTTSRRGTYRVFCTPTKRASLLAKFNGGSAGTLNGKQVIGASSGVRRAVYKV